MTTMTFNLSPPPPKCRLADSPPAISSLDLSLHPLGCLVEVFFFFFLPRGAHAEAITLLVTLDLIYPTAPTLTSFSSLPRLLCCVRPWLADRHDTISSRGHQTNAFQALNSHLCELPVILKTRWWFFFWRIYPVYLFTHTDNLYISVDYPLPSETVFFFFAFS